MPARTLQVSQGTFDLVRFPYSGNKTLRAWDAADEYLLAHVAGSGTEAEAGADAGAGAGAGGGEDATVGDVLILNDAFGALSLGMAKRSPQMMSDSYLSHLAVRENFARNGMDEGAVSLLSSMATPRGPVGLLLAKVPKALSLLEDQLHRIRPFLTTSWTHRNLSSTCRSRPSPRRPATAFAVELSVKSRTFASQPKSTSKDWRPNPSAHPETTA